MRRAGEKVFADLVSHSGEVLATEELDPDVATRMLEIEFKRLLRRGSNGGGGMRVRAWNQLRTWST